MHIFKAFMDMGWRDGSAAAFPEGPDLISRTNMAAQSRADPVVVKYMPVVRGVCWGEVTPVVPSEGRG